MPDATMFSDLPLDDQIGKTFYIDGALFTLVYDQTLARFALRRIDGQISLAHAEERIATGELLWDPLEYFEALGAETSIEAVQRYVTLLSAFFRSPLGVDMTDWALRARLDARLNVYRAWLTRRALKSGDASDAATGSSSD